MNNDKLNPGQIGQDRAIQDPNDALKKSQGTYDDAASRLSEAQRFPVGPMGPAPSPFKGTQNG